MEDNVKVSWTAQAGFLRQMGALKQTALGALAACAVVAAVLLPFSMVEGTMEGRLFPLFIGGVMLAVAWSVVLILGVARYARRGRITVEYSLYARRLSIAERGKLVCATELPLENATALAHTRNGIKLRCGGKRARIFCNEKIGKNIENAVCSATHENA